MDRKNTPRAQTKPKSAAPKRIKAGLPAASRAENYPTRSAAAFAEIAGGFITDAAVISKIRNDLSAYCKRDTPAMVEVHKARIMLGTFAKRLFQKWAVEGWGGIFCAGKEDLKPRCGSSGRKSDESGAKKIRQTDPIHF